MPETIAILTGPTAVGKTDVAILAAEALNAEIISADSMAVYRGLEVATAKPSLEQRLRVPHHLIDVVDATQPFTVADYRRLALQAIRSTAARGRLPLVVGGTRLYIWALTSTLFEGPAADPALRSRLSELAVREGHHALHRRLAEVDSVAAARLSPNDLKRIIRALEVYEATGTPISELQAASRRSEPPCAGPMVALVRDRSQLYARINARADAMMAAGLVEEVASLLAKGVGEHATAMQGHGYKEIAGYLLGQYDREEAVRLLKRNTRRYAKRQLSWLRQEPAVAWVNADRPAEEVAAEVVRLIRAGLGRR